MQNEPKIAIPQFSSMKQFEGALGFPVALQKVCKQAGCPGFKPGGRIDGPEVIRFYFNRQDALEAIEKPPAGVHTWREALNRAQTQRETLKLQRERGELVDMAQVQSEIAQAGLFLFNELDQLAQEWPPVLVGAADNGHSRARQEVHRRAAS